MSEPRAAVAGADAGESPAGRQRPLQGSPDRSLYIYWRIQPGLEAEALALLAGLQGRLAADEPGLQVRRLTREEVHPSVTVMEIYTRPGGVDAALQSRIEARMRPALQPCCAGDRHVEVFVDADAPGGAEPAAHPAADPADAGITASAARPTA